VGAALLEGSEGGGGQFCASVKTPNSGKGGITENECYFGPADPRWEAKVRIVLSLPPVRVNTPFRNLSLTP
jgi:hypothetical protein